MHGPGYGRIITASSTGEVTAFFQEENGNIKSFGVYKIFLYEFYIGDKLY